MLLKIFFLPFFPFRPPLLFSTSLYLFHALSLPLPVFPAKFPNLVLSSILPKHQWAELTAERTAGVLWPQLVRPSLLFFLSSAGCLRCHTGSYLTLQCNHLRVYSCSSCGVHSSKALGNHRCWLHEVYCCYKKSVTIPVEFPSLLCSC